MARPRVIISSDIGGNDKDDAQSLIHALLYADDIDYRGIVVTRTDDGGRGGIGNGGAMAREIVEAYGDDLDALRAADGGYPGAGALRSVIREGATNPDWPGGVSDGARLIIGEARAASPSDPLYVLTWGPIHDAARALREAPDIVDRIRIIAIDGIGQDRAHQDAYRWLMDAVEDDPRYEDLWMIDAAETFRGIHVDKNGAKNPGQNLDWVEDNVADHGALGALFREKYTDDLYGRSSSPDGLKMGDTPSLLYLLDGANDDNPAASSWGGSFRKSGIGPNMWTDKSEASQRMGEFDGARSVYDKREAFLADFAERLDRADGSGSTSRPDTPEPEGDGDGDAGRLPDRSGSSGSAEIGTGRTEIEALELSNYAVEAKGNASGDAVVNTSGTGRATGSFEGPEGAYRMSVGYVNEDDGAASWEIAVNGRVQSAWTGRGGSGEIETHSDSLRLAPGDTIEVRGEREKGEQARLDFIELDRTGGGESRGRGEDEDDSDPVPQAGSSGERIGTGRTQLEDWSLKGYDAVERSDASGGAWIETDGKGTAASRFDGPDGEYTAEVFYFNEPDGASRWRMLVDGETVARWDGSGGDASMERASFEIDLDRGDTLEIVGQRDAGEFARLDALVFTPAGDVFG